MLMLGPFALPIAAQPKPPAAKSQKFSFRDFIDIKVPRLFKTPGRNGKPGRFDQAAQAKIALADSLVATDSGQQQIEGSKGFLSGTGQGGAFPGSENFGAATIKLGHELSQKYLQDSTFKVRNLFKEAPPLLAPVSFQMPTSLLREDTTDLYDESFAEDIVEVQEQVQIDSVWLTLTSYFAIWDSRNINPYNFDLNQFKDSVNLTLFDTAQVGRWSPPLASNRLTSEFGMRGWRWHHGVDLDLNIGDPVYSSFEGVVRIKRAERGGYGNFIVLRHRNGLETLYGHLSQHLVKLGEEVKAGQLIGLGGNTGRSTGPHLHYEVRYNGLAFDPKFIYDFDKGEVVSSIFTLKPEHFRHLTHQRQTVTVTLRYGDTLGRLARRYQTTVAELCQLNNFASAKVTLRPGRKLRVK
jgi:murein DD-endopeptidase MepM/ murein hydrolase activator NlpD